MLTNQSQDFAKWYNEVVLRADLAEYSPVKGCMIIKPYGYAIWENIQQALDKEIKKLGAENVYFPLFIPESFLKKETEHVEGFAPEVAWVTYGGQKKLRERLAVRPTSETIMYDVFAKWLHSYRDLPFKINQWANIVRWEMRPRLFLRTLEFLWQEGHTAHASKKEADEMARRALKMYYDFAENYLAIHSVPGLKTENEKFAGALYTLAIESLMLDNKCLQMGTSHNLGQNFSKAFGIKFLDKKGKQNYVWQTSWGVSTRLIGGLIMGHGDDKGLVLPPKLAPYQVIIIPIWASGKAKKDIEKYIKHLEEILSKRDIRFKTDWRPTQTPGWKFHEWELKGAPLKVEIGIKEKQKKEVTFSPRDTLKKQTVSLNYFEKNINKILDALQKRLLNKSRKFTRDNTRQVKSFSEFKEIMKKEGGFIKAFWCESNECEEKIQEETKATIRCIPSPFSLPDLQKNVKHGKCIRCGKKAKIEVFFAKAY